MSGSGPGTEWKTHKRLHITAGVHSAALANYQYPIKCIVGDGANGSYTHQTGIQGSLFYIKPNECRPDFYDFRFYCGSTKYDFFRIPASTIAGVQSEWVVEIQSDLAAGDGVLDIYYGAFGDAGAVDASSAADTFVAAPIGGVVGAWKMEEADAEVNPTVIVDDNQAAAFTPFSCTLANVTTAPVTGTNKLQITVTGDAWWTAIKTFAAQNWSSLGSRIRITLDGNNTGKIFRVLYTSDNTWANYARYSIIDNFVGRQTFSIPFSAFSLGGTINLAAIIAYRYDNGGVNQQGTVWTVDRAVIDVGVIAEDSSGYGNNGAATGTTIVAGPFTGKNARQFNGLGDFISVANATVLKLTTTNFSIFVKIKILAAGGTWAIISKGGGAHAGNYGYVYRSSNRFDCNNNDATPTSATATGFTLNAWNNGCVVANRNGNAIVYKNTSAGSPVNITAESDIGSTAALLIGKYLSTADTQMILSNIFITTELLTTDQITTLNDTSIYPDSGLLTGSICPRKIASTTNPTHGSWEPEQVYYPKPIYDASPIGLRIKARPLPKQLSRKKARAILNYYIAKNRDVPA
jgi:hypothetical protein